MEMVHFIPTDQRRLVLLAAQAGSAPVLIYGAAGTGKGAIARWIHENGPRVGQPFLIAHQKISLAEQLLQASGGTFVIPEIGEWPFSIQKTLLTYLKTRSIPHPKESEMPILAHARIIGTTSQAIEGRAQGGLFNMELLEKLNVFRIEMPPLAKRTDEFDDIVLGILEEITQEVHKDYLRNLSTEVWNRLRSYDWPGNLRELRNVLRLAITATQGDRIEVSDLPDFGYTRINFQATREQFEKVYLLELLKTFDWDIDKTCSMTQIDKVNFLSKIKLYGITLDTQD